MLGFGAFATIALGAGLFGAFTLAGIYMQDGPLKSPVAAGAWTVLAVLPIIIGTIWFASKLP
jgi:hypothetical protein